MEQDQQSHENAGLERRLSEMTALVEEMRRQVAELQKKMQRQAALHEEERKRWHEKSRQMQEERERLLKHGAIAQKSKPTVTGILASSRAICGSKCRAHSFPGNRSRSFNTLSGVKLLWKFRNQNSNLSEFKAKLLEVVRQRREFLASNLQRQRRAVEADQTARALKNLCIFEQTNKTTTTSSPLGFSKFLEQKQRPLKNLGLQIEDLDKQRRMQQQLVSVLHARNCDSSQMDVVGNVICDMPFCSVTSKLLEHMRTCTFVTKCPTPMCSLTREVVDHYKNCETDSCPICEPAKQKSISTREHLLRFMDTICKGFDEDASVETSSASSQVVRLINPRGELLSLDTQMPAPMFLPTILPSTSLEGCMEAQTEDTSMEMKMESSDAHE